MTGQECEGKLFNLIANLESEGGLWQNNDEDCCEEPAKGPDASVVYWCSDAGTATAARCPKTPENVCRLPRLSGEEKRGHG
jgi:hypothetical protein